MNIVFKPYCLTRFHVFENYEIYNVQEDYGEEESNHPYKTNLQEDYEEFYEEVTGTSLVNNDAEVFSKTYKANVPIYARVNPLEIKDTLQGKSTHSYNPLEDAPNLYTELAKLDYFDTKALEKFIQKFGLPQGIDLLPLNIYSQHLYEMNIFHFYMDLENFKRVFNIFKALQTNNAVDIAECASEFKEYMEESERISTESYVKDFVDKRMKQIMDNILEDKAYASEESKGLFHFLEQKRNEIWKEETNKINIHSLFSKNWSSLEGKDNKTIAQQYLVELINSESKGNSTYTLINNKIDPATTFNDLFEVAYFQLGRAIVGNIEMRKCENPNCGAIFEVTHESRRFCPPFPGNKLSTCQNAYNQRLKRKRKKDKLKVKELNDSGLSIVEISKEVGRSIDEIEGWLNY